MAMVPEQPFNGNSSMDFGASSNRYRQSPVQASLSPQPGGLPEMRLGRSASSASSSSGGYRVAPNGSMYTAQRRPLPGAHEHNQLRKQPSAGSMRSTSSAGRYGPPPGMDRYGSANGSHSVRNGHPGSRSTPDLNMSAMKMAINAVASDVGSNPVPQIPTAMQQQHQRVTPLSVQTDIAGSASMGSNAANPQIAQQPMSASAVPPSAAYRLDMQLPRQQHSKSSDNVQEVAGGSATNAYAL
ncbi:hypothetical protein EC988_007352, partial [Linderina pennispora]